MSDANRRSGRDAALPKLESLSLAWLVALSALACTAPPATAAPTSGPGPSGGASGASVSAAAGQVFPFRPAWRAKRFPGNQAYEDAVVVHVNALRKSLGLAALVVDERLRVGARQHTAEMIQKGYYSHDSPVSAWKSPAQRACHAGFLEPFVSENIGLVSGYSDVALALFESWKGSPGHYRNMVDPKVSRIGVGVGDTQRNGQTVTLATQLFGADSLDLRGIAVSIVRQRVLRLDVTMESAGDLEVKAWRGRLPAGEVARAGSRHTFQVDLPLPIGPTERIDFAVKVGGETPLVCAHVEVSAGGVIKKDVVDYHQTCLRLRSFRASAKTLVLNRRVLSGEARAVTPEAQGARYFLNRTWGPLLGLRRGKWTRFSEPLPQADVVDFSLILTRLQKDYLRLDFRRPDPFVCP